MTKTRNIVLGGQTQYWLLVEQEEVLRGVGDQEGALEDRGLQAHLDLDAEHPQEEMELTVQEQLHAILLEEHLHIPINGIQEKPVRLLPTNVVELIQ